MNHPTSHRAILLGLVLGVAAIAIQLQSYVIFSFVIAAYLAGFVYLKSQVAFSPQNASTLASLFIGSIMGIAGLVGCVMCQQ